VIQFLHYAPQIFANLKRQIQMEPIVLQNVCVSQELHLTNLYRIVTEPHFKTKKRYLKVISEFW